MRVLGLLTLAVLGLGGLGVELVAGGPANLAVLDLAAGWALLGAAAAGGGLAAGCRGLLGLAGAAWFLGTAAADWGSLQRSADRRAARRPRGVAAPDDRPRGCRGRRGARPAPGARSIRTRDAGDRTRGGRARAGAAALGGRDVRRRAGGGGWDPRRGWRRGRGYGTGLDRGRGELRAVGWVPATAVPRRRESADRRPRAAARRAFARAPVGPCARGPGAGAALPAERSRDVVGRRRAACPSAGSGRDAGGGG